MTISVKNTCVRVKVTIGKQSAYITDQQITDNVEKSFNTHGRAKVIKRAFKNCNEHRKVQSKANEVYQTYVNNTLPWDSAYRVAQSKGLLELLSSVNDKIQEAKDSIETFLSDYDNHVAKDIAESGGMMKAEDYPTADEFRNKYYFKIDLAPVSDAEDFRNIEGLTEEEKEQLRESARETERNTIMGAMKDARERLYKVVFHMKDRLDTYKGGEGERLHKSVLSNVEDCVKVLRNLNITKDPELDAIMDELENSVLGTDIERLKVFPDVRKDTVTKVDEILDKMFWLTGGKNG